MTYSSRFRRFPRRLSLRLLLAGFGLASGAGVWALVNESQIAVVGQLHQPAAEHVEDDALFVTLVQSGQAHEAFEQAFEIGDELFETRFNALDGVGANVGDGTRFTRVPRADLAGPGQWANHTPMRITGPNAQACNACHLEPFDDGAGSPQGNVHRDPQHTGVLRSFIQRNTPHLFAPGAPQRLAEEMTDELHAIRDRVREEACRFGSASRLLAAKGIPFGRLAARRSGGSPCRVDYDSSRVEGVAADLVVRPFQWKGANTTVRDFNRGAAHNELGMQAVEIAGDDVDGDFDGVKNELTVGDMTALAVYLAAQPRPTTKLELASLELIEPLDAAEVAAIGRGQQVFGLVGCANCHVPSLRLENRVFSEPSQNPHFRDASFPAGQDPVARGVDRRFPVTFDLTRDQPDNVVTDAGGNVTFRLGSLVRDSRGRAVVDLYGDLKRHYMGPGLAETIDDIGSGPATFLTENLWGVGSTAPYLHDGRATTLTEAILEHGGEAAASRNAFLARPVADRQALIAFLDNLVLFKMEEDEATGQLVVTIAPKSVRVRRDRLGIRQR
jgi:mono/diheme cytochrome c family protein